MLEENRTHVDDGEFVAILPRLVDCGRTAAVIGLLKNPPVGGTIA